MISRRRVLRGMLRGSAVALGLPLFEAMLNDSGTALAAGASVREAAQLANYAAGVEVGKPGVATVSPEEVLAVHEERFDQIGKLRRGGLI